MKELSSFQARFATLINWILSCFDRVIFKGYLPISRPYEFERFVDSILKIRRADFLKFVAPQWSDRIVEHSRKVAQKQGRTWVFAAKTIDKDAWAKARLGGEGAAHPALACYRQRTAGLGGHTPDLPMLQQTSCLR